MSTIQVVQLKRTEKQEQAHEEEAAKLYGVTITKHMGYCDYAIACTNCHATLLHAAGNIDSALNMFRVSGWGFKDYKAYCLDCLTKATRRPDREKITKLTVSFALRNLRPQYICLTCNDGFHVEDAVFEVVIKTGKSKAGELRILSPCHGAVTYVRPLVIVRKGGGRNG